MIEFEGLLTLEIDGVAYHVTKYPDRKRYCLTRAEGTVHSAAAYFSRERDAVDFARWLDKLARRASSGRV